MFYFSTATGLVLLLSLFQQAVSSPEEGLETSNTSSRTSIISTKTTPKADITASTYPVRSSVRAVLSISSNVDTQSTHGEPTGNPHTSGLEQIKGSSRSHQSGSPAIPQSQSPAEKTSTSSSTHNTTSKNGQTEDQSKASTVISEAFPTTFKPATTTIDKAQETSEVPAVALMFGSLHTNRKDLDDPRKKQKYIDNVQDTKTKTGLFFKSLKTQPAPPSGCSGSKKRSLGSTLKSLIGDIPKLASCATKVVDNLESKVKLPDPPTSEIDDLTDTLSQISDYMKEPEKNNEPTTSVPDKQTGTGTSTQSCTSSTAVSQCTATVSLSTAFYSGTTGKYTVSTATTTTCSTITTCHASATTKTTTVSTATATPTLADGKIMCGRDCLGCKLSTTSASPKKRAETLQWLPSWVKRSLDYWRNLGDTRIEYFDDTTGAKIILDEHQPDPDLKPGTLKVPHKNYLSTAKSMDFKNEPGRLFVEGLVGCTSVAIISEAGAWVSHHWEDPMFTFTGTADIFDDKVLNAIRSGRRNDDMTAAFPLGQEGGILHSSNNPHIYIMTPENSGQKGVPLYVDKVNRLEAFLTGGSSPWAGVQIQKRLYTKPESVDVDAIAAKYPNNIGKANDEILSSQQDILRRYWKNKDARGRLLVEFDPHQTLDPNSDDYMDDQNPAKAMWRISIETWDQFQQWCPREGQQPAGNQKRAACSMKKGNSTSTSTSTGTSIHSATISQRTTSGSIKTTETDATKTTTSSPHTTSAFQCETYADPDQSDGEVQCQCPGSEEKLPMLSSTSGMKSYQPCGYTALPTKMPTTTMAPFTATLSDGSVARCASSTYYNYAVNTVPECAGSSTIIATITSIASSYSASLEAHASTVSASASSASWSSAAAKPSANCIIEGDDGWGTSSFKVDGINDWAGDNGELLLNQEKGCGMWDNWHWYTGVSRNFEGKPRDTQIATFDLDFFKGGCVEDAIATAGGPRLTCQHSFTKRDWKKGEAGDNFGRRWSWKHLKWRGLRSTP